MTLQQLRAFLAVVEEGSFRGAARRLGLSQAGLTTSVQALEHSVGQSLLRRSVRGVSPTDAGLRLLPRAQLIDREARRALDEAAGPRGLGGVLHVGVGPTTTAMLLPRVVPDFHQRHPDVTLRLVPGLHDRLRAGMHQGLLDLALLAVPDDVEWPGMRRTLLMRGTLAIVARSGHPLARARTLAELAQAEWILMGSPGGPGGTVVRLFDDQGLPPPRVAATCEGFTEVGALLAATDWLALLPHDLVAAGLVGPGTAAIPVRTRLPRFEICLVTRVEPPPTPAAATFATMCASWARVARAAGALGGRRPADASR